MTSLETVDLALLKHAFRGDTVLIHNLGRCFQVCQRCSHFDPCTILHPAKSTCLMESVDYSCRTFGEEKSSHLTWSSLSEDAVMQVARRMNPSLCDDFIQAQIKPTSEMLKCMLIII